MDSILRRFLSVFVIAAVSSLVAFGEEENGQGAKVEPISKRILGDWEVRMSIDEESLKKYIKDNNVPEDVATTIKNQIEATEIYLTFQEGGTAKTGSGEPGDVKFIDSTWKIKSEKGNHAEIVITHGNGEPGMLDATFQKDGTIVARPSPRENHNPKTPYPTLTLKKLEKLFEEKEPKTRDLEKPDSTEAATPL
jgi:hypothetical protein